MNQAFGLLTPPLGLPAMTSCAVAGVPMTRIQKLPHIMMIPILIVVILCSLMPWTVLILPKLLVPNWM
jgi:TRAP-type C4-dicarboxylate transport system permease large subunit